MSRRAQSMPPSAYLDSKPARSRCTAAVCYSWKILTCIVSHTTLITLVVFYCFGGAYLFQYLEEDNEKEVKQSVKDMRQYVVDMIWNITDNEVVLREDNWTSLVEKELKGFEVKILNTMKKKGWDGDENVNSTQWTFMGSLFYSIIVITTIGYGHIAPRTDWGKVTTIFYAILGIPLMLLCLSTIGDVMATSFRFLYWRVCCFVCTRQPKKKRNKSFGRRPRYSRSQPPSYTSRSVRHSQRSADSGFATIEPPGLPHAYSDPELRYANIVRAPFRGDLSKESPDRRKRKQGSGYDLEYDCGVQRNNSQQSAKSQSSEPRRFSNRIRNRERMRERHTIERDEISRYKGNNSSIDDAMPAKRAQSQRSVRASSVGKDINRIYSQTLPTNRSRSQPNTPKNSPRALDQRHSYCGEIDEEVLRKTPILCNRYAIDELDRKESSYRSRHNKRRSSASFPNQSSDGETNQRILNERQKRNTNDSNMRNKIPPRVYELRKSGNRESFYHHNKRNPSRYGNRLELPDIPPGGFFRDNGNRNCRNDPYRNSKRESKYDDYYDEHEFENEFEMQPVRKDRRSRRPAAPLPPSPRIMSPMGFAIHRQARIRDDDSYYDDEGDSYGDLSPKNRPVPIWLCVFLVVGYILAGAALFSKWENWSYLDSAYFCFITLTTIGFGDFVPAQGVKDSSKQSIALCSLYLLFGISLLAMSFNLVQEEVIANVKEVARRLGILKQEENVED